MKRYMPPPYQWKIAGFILSGLFVCSVRTSAQTLRKDTLPERTVVVENEYNPKITDAAKVNLLPVVEEPAVIPGKIEYATAESPAGQWDDYRPMLSFREIPLPPDRKKGYARLGYGNYGNVDVKLDYLFRISENDRLSAALFLDGRNGTLELPPPPEVPVATVDWKSRYYSSGLNLFYEHLFRKFTLGVAGELGMDHFNYHQLPQKDDQGIWTYLPGFKDNQHQLKGQFRALLASADETLPLQFNLEAGYAYFKRKYFRGVKVDDTEQIATFKADVCGQIDEQQKVGLKLDLNGLFYSVEAYDNYASLEANPYYVLENDHWKLRLGAQVDFSFGKGNVLEVSPDVDVSYVFAKKYVVYVKATGGRTINDYRRMSSLDPYWAIYRPQWWTDTYVPVDASLGIKASPFDGFRFNLSAGYRIARHDLCFGSFIPEERSGYAYSYVQSANLKELYTGLELSYSYKEIAALSALVTYHRWNDGEQPLLLMKPELELKFAADLNLFSKTYLNLGYEYVSRPEVRLRPAEKEYRMSPVSRLSLGLTYRFWKELSAYVKLNNLLNREYQYVYSYPSEKLNVLAGLSFRF